MRNAYALLGLTFIIVFGSAHILIERAEAPSLTDVPAFRKNLKNNYVAMSLTLTADDFEPNGLIPSRYTCQGENIHPALAFTDVPAETKSFVLLMHDPDIPDFVKEKMDIEVFDHWVLYDIPGTATGVPDGSVLARFVGILGANSTGKAEYTGPCPPDGEHRYIFELYALSVAEFPVDFDAPPSLNDLRSHLEGDMKKYVIEKTTLTGRYEQIMKEGPLSIAEKISVRESAGDYVVSNMGVPESRRDAWVAEAVVSQNTKGTILVKNESEGMTVVFTKTSGKLVVVEGYEN